MTGSTDAIAHVQEGIVVDVNPAWAELFGHEDAAGLLGQPLMDFFQQRSHAALKGALVATAQGRWNEHSLQAVAVMPSGTELPIAREFERFEYDGEPAIRQRVATQQRDVETLTRQLEEALESMRLAGVRRLPVVDDGGRVTGVLSIDDVLEHLAGQLGSVAGSLRHEQAAERLARP